MPRYTIDRFEAEDWAVLEDEQARTFRVPRQWLPTGAREGDVVNAAESPAAPAAHSVRFELDTSAREQRLAEADRLREQLPRGPKGDVSL
jgi:hypothetical protein